MTDDSIIRAVTIGYRDENHQKQIVYAWRFNEPGKFSNASVLVYHSD